VARRQTRWRSQERIDGSSCHHLIGTECVDFNEQLDFDEKENTPIAD
jgi:hypothetical protein